jgi:predicted alpha/beta-hydrolase family hydrolase
MRVVLAHGASGNAASMRPWVEGLEHRGIEARAIDLPVKRAEEAVEVYRSSADPGPDVLIGGQSYGGRVATLLAAEPDAQLAGLLLMCYPLHPPGRPDSLRAAHLSAIRAPTLFLSGEADPFAKIDLLRRTVADQMSGAQLVTYPRTGHSLRSVMDDALDRMASFIRSLEA